jgi:Protein of unknown function (DUF1194)
MRSTGRLVLLVLLLALAAVPAQAASPVDLALVLAVDVSRSIDDEEFELQRAGYAAAFRDRRVISAIENGSVGAIAVTYMQWSGARQQIQVIPWTIIRDAAGAERLAKQLATADRAITAGSTSVSGAIDTGVALLRQSEVAATRRVIDVSGDGSNNNGRLPIYARDEAVASGITINGLTILNDEPLLDVYYRDNVIGGPGAFVVTTEDFDQFASAILAKLIREIAEAPIF